MTTHLKPKYPSSLAYRLTYVLSFTISIVNLVVFIWQSNPEYHKWPQTAVIAPYAASQLWLFFALFVPPVSCADEFPKDKYLAPIMHLQFILGCWLSVVYIGKNIKEPRVDRVPIWLFIPVYIFCDVLYIITLDGLGLHVRRVRRHLRWVHMPTFLLGLGLARLFGWDLSMKPVHDEELGMKESKMNLEQSSDDSVPDSVESFEPETESSVESA